MIRTALACAAAIPLLIAGSGEVVQFVDRASRVGITVPNVFGGVEHNDSILESTGNGVAIVDYDGDGMEDVFVANGLRSDRNPTASPSQLYHNDGKGHFTEV